MTKRDDGPDGAVSSPTPSAAARVFVNYISQKSLEWAKGGQVPARKQVRESAEFKALPEQAGSFAEIEAALAAT